MDTALVRTKILFVDGDASSFEFRKCMASVLTSLPPVELHHATDATEALGLLETLHPDVIVLDGELTDEVELFLDSICVGHPPIVLQTNGSVIGRMLVEEELITKIEKNESIDGLHKTLTLASRLGIEATEGKPLQFVH